MAPQQQQIITLPNGQQQIVTLPGTQPQQQIITLPGGQQQLVTLPASATAPGQPQQMVPVPSLPQPLMPVPGGGPNSQTQQPQGQQMITLPGGQQAIVRMAAPNQQVGVIVNYFFSKNFQSSSIKKIRMATFI